MRGYYGRRRKAMMVLIVNVGVIYRARIAAITTNSELLTMTLFGLGWVRHLNLVPEEVRLPDGL